MPPSPTWFRRYQHGDRDQVWEELRRIGDGVRDPAFAREAQQVCDEMARRARYNVERIIERLSRQGYRFHGNDDEQATVIPHYPPTETAGELLDGLSGRFGVLPMTFTSWVRIVGDVWLVGTHPRWPESASADPLVIEAEGSRYPGASLRSTQAYLDEEFDAWCDGTEDDPTTGSFVFPLSPDQLHKENTSGGGPYGISLPGAGADGCFVAESTSSFVSYLNEVFRNGGFPARTGSALEQQVRRSLAEGLLPL
jgi:hypothetical protein